MDSFRELVSIYAIDFVISLYLIFLIDVQTSCDGTKRISPEDPNDPSLTYTRLSEQQHCLGLSLLLIHWSLI
jgi:hypothetical protein